MTYNEMRQIARQLVAGVVRFTRTSRGSDSGHNDAVEGRGNDDEAPSLGVRRLWPFGIRSVPPAGCDAVVVHANGGSTNGVMVGAESGKYGPSDLESGENALYCLADGTIVKLTKVGKIEMVAAEGQDLEATLENFIVNAAANAKLLTPDGKTYVGSDSGTQPIALGTASKTNFDNIKSTLDDIKTFLTNFKTEFNNHVHLETGASTNTPTTPFTGTPPTPSAVTDPRATLSETV